MGDLGKEVRVLPAIPAESVKVSFVIPTYNRTDMFERVLHSLHRQNDPNYEVLVSIDDDYEIYPATQRVVDKYVSMGMPIKSFYTGQYKRGHGWSVETYPYNVGIRHATGDITVLNSGDVLSVSNCIAQYRSTVTPHNIVVSTTHAVTADTQNRIEEFPWRANPSALLFKGSCYKMFSGCGTSYTTAYPVEEAHTPYHFQMGLRTEHLHAIHGFDEDFYGMMQCGDDDIATRLKRSGLQFLWCMDILAVHQFHECPASISKYSAPHNTEWESGHTLCAVRASADIVRNEEDSWGTYPRVGVPSSLHLNRSFNMVPGISQELLATYADIENKVIALNNLDKEFIWHWAVEYSMTTEGKPPYISLWKSEKSSMLVADRELSGKIELITSVIDQEIVKRTKQE